MLLAASRGYDVTAEGFRDDPAYRETTGPVAPVDAAKNVLAKVNADAKDKLGVDYTTLSATDVRLLAGAFSTNVNLDAEGSFIDKLLLGIGKILQWITDKLCFGSYIVGICLFAVVIEILMLPFAIKQQKNSIRQAKLRPKEMAIRNKYKGRTDAVTQQKIQQEIQELYQRENFSPYSGCLQLFLQMPILLALYYIVIDPLHYVLGQASTVSTALSTYYTTSCAAGGLGQALAQGGRGTIEILSSLRENASWMEGIKSFGLFENGEALYERLAGLALPNFRIGSINFGLTPTFTTDPEKMLLLIVPVLTFVAYFLSSKLTRKMTAQSTMQTEGVDQRQLACSNAMMDFLMPAFSTYIAFIVPAVVGVYWVFRSLLSLLKQFIMTRVMPLPKFTEEDYKAAARELAGKKTTTVQKSDKVGKVRSLHRIDDEDFEDTRERGLARRAALEEQEQAKKAKNTPFEAPKLKEDDRKESAKDENTEDSASTEDKE